ncbi:hypothetical protein A0O28_0026710 [Trichoderma guizhouense]|uniref:Uncharacterized protein n=1 Tax=Trichoderma guizhouense TaxID=1491466 RepID=A0A1T3CTH2_9HYPO|nr:hypothetical protein A0O28_0026710 [Trichoderma guizhouense]
MEFFATFPLTGAKRKATTLTNEPGKKPKISCSATASEIHDGNETEGDDEAEYYQESEDEGKDEDKDGQDGNEDEKKHDEDKNEEQNGKVKEHLANQQDCADDFHRIELHELQIRSLRDSFARLKESFRVEQQARMDLQLDFENLTQRVNELEKTIEEHEETVEELGETIEKLEEAIQNQELKNKRNEETIKIQ